MKQVFLAGSGQVEVFDVPLVGRMADAVLVQNAFSLISTGTEGAAVASKRGLLGTCEKLWASSHRLRDVWNLARTTGMAQALEAVRSKLTDHTPLGYSSAGQVVEIDGPELPFTLGQRVACMGTGFANHAEFIAVPKNLAVPVPENVSLEEAAFGAIGCIALQGIRRLELSPGERIGVIGLGLIGQVCVRLLAAMGYQTYGLDLSRPRAQKASEVPGVAAWATDALDSVDYLRQLTDGEMLDGVVVCAAAKSSVPINLAFDLCRQRGRVSVVGDVGLDLERPKMYRKEIEVRLSCSYGPGRYDNQYELGGQDYPHGYVRWTERRNLEFFLSMLAAGRLSVRPLINAHYPVDRVDEAYRRIKQADPATFGVLLDYGMPAGVCKPVDPSARVLRLASAIHLSAGSRIGLGLIGVGGYAKGVHIPNLKKLYDEVEIRGTASLSGGSAAIVARKLGARFATGDYRKLLEEPGIDAVLICTRHASHARIAGCSAGKHGCGKLLATTVEDAEQVGCRACQRPGRARRIQPPILALSQSPAAGGGDPGPPDARRPRERRRCLATLEQHIGRRRPPVGRRRSFLRLLQLVHGCDARGNARGRRRSR